MTKLTAKRLEIIECIMRDYGIEYGALTLMSLWDLADNINNTWNAQYFVNTDRFESTMSEKSKFVLADCYRHHMFRAIRDAVRKKAYSSCIYYRCGSNNVEYLVVVL